MRMCVCNPHSVSVREAVSVRKEVCVSEFAVSRSSLTLFTLLDYYSSGYFAFGLNHQTWLLHPVFPSELKLTHSEISFS